MVRFPRPQTCVTCHRVGHATAECPLLRAPRPGARPLAPQQGAAPRVQAQRQGQALQGQAQQPPAPGILFQ